MNSNATAMSRMLIPAALGLGVLISGSAWVRRETAETPVSPAHAQRPLPIGVPHDVRIVADSTEFVLPADSSARYLLIIGSLGDPHRAHRVEVECGPANELPSARGRVSRIPFSDGTRSVTVSRSRKTEFWTPDPDPPPDPSRSTTSIIRTFHLHVTDGSLDDPRHYVAIGGREIDRGRHVTVLLDDAIPLTDRLRRTAWEIVRLHEQRVLPRTRQLLGSHVDVDGDGRLTVLLTPWLGRLQGGRTSLGGLVRPADFRHDVPAPFSNGCDVLFLNSSVTPGPRLHALLAHEYAHVVTFSRRAAAPCRKLPDSVSPTVEDDWLSEGLAHVCEHLHDAGWSNLEHRIGDYLRSPSDYPLVIANYYESGLWRNHGCRGATFLFLRWCVDQYGDEFLRRLVDGERVGVANIEHASGQRFEDLFRRWCLAMYVAGADDSTRAAVAPGVPRFRSLSLRGRLGEDDLQGPRVESWTVESGRNAFAVRGTAAVFFEMRGSAAARRIRIQAAPGARLQVTLLRLPDGT